MQLKITDKDVYEELYMKKNTYYAFKKRSPRQVELIKKGMLAERLMQPDVFDSIK